MRFGAAATPEQIRRWRGHPLTAGAVKAAAIVAPVAASFGSSVIAGRLIARPDGLGASALWWIGLLTMSTVVLIATERVARRLLPLAALLKLSLVFPDQAPSRFGVALRTGTTRQLQRRLAAYRLQGTAASGASDLLGLVAALNVHDPLTRGHSERVRALSDLLAEQLGMNADDRERLHWAALLHDIGKLAVPTEILNKPGKPTDEEWAILKTHPDEGVRLVEGPVAEWLGEWAAAIGEHHEKFDGTGYPKGLAGHEISRAGRLVAVADVFDVITATRSYKKAMTAQEARLELTRCAGTHFDPEMVRAFLEISIGKLRRVTGPFAWLLQIATLGRGLAGAPAVTAAAIGAAAFSTGVAVGVIPSPLALAAERPPAVEVVVPDRRVGDAPPIVPDNPPDRDPSGAPPATDGGAKFPTAGDESTPTSLPGGGDAVPPVATIPTGDLPVSTTIPSPPTTATDRRDPAATSTTSVRTGSPADTSTTVGVASSTTTATNPPLLATPAISVPGVAITVPTIVIALPPISVPTIVIALPPISVPPISVPPISVPIIDVTITVPPVTVPVTVPAITVPAIFLPPVSLPPVTVPPITVPPITLPPVTLPHLFS